MQTLHSTLLFAAFAALASLPTGAQAASAITCTASNSNGLRVYDGQSQCLVVAGLLNQLPNVAGIDCVRLPLFPPRRGRVMGGGGSILRTAHMRSPPGGVAPAGVVVNVDSGNGGGMPAEGVAPSSVAVREQSGGGGCES